ncbi:hypothetical protein [Arthrobacter sp. KBS0703]|uniref:hypothetical protein n=1 Tax=Arthrobacter sp. KBS0703 TaxID=1955698 RepID=UPI0037C17D34
MTSPARRLPLRFSTQTLLLQLGVVLLVVLLSGAVHAWLTYERLGREAENQALTLARTVASDPSVRAEVQAISRQPGTPAGRTAGRPADGGRRGARTRTGALFVVITDETGLRLAHPDAERLGERVSTDPSEALAGREVTTRNTGTLGPSAGAKVPVFAPGTGAGPVPAGRPRRGGRGERRLFHRVHRPEPGPGHRAHRADGGRLTPGGRPGLVPAPAQAAAPHPGPGTRGNQHPGPRPGGRARGRG